MLRLFIRCGYQVLQHDLKVGDRLLIGRGEVGKLRAGKQSGDGTQVVETGLRTTSQEHVRLSVEPDGRVIAEDCGSTNGTYLRLVPSQAVEVPENSELMLGQELTLRLNSPRWGTDRLHETIMLQRPADLLSFLQARLKDLVRSVRLVSQEEAGATTAMSLNELRLALIDQAQLVVEWQRTSDADAESWLRAVVSAYNKQRALDSSARDWEFTAVSPLRQEALRLAKRVVSSNCTVLLQGASGSGTEVLASDLHNHSPRAGQPFVVVNCGALDAESLLFGYARRTSTGAQEVEAGQLEQADGGTLFLDEIDELPLALQVKLLRVLETHKVKPLGGQSERAVDIRVISATHRSLAEMVRDKMFRGDLYHHLSTIPIFIPAIEPPDIAALARLFLSSLSKVRGIPLNYTEFNAVAALAAGHVWPGGVRELRNAMERYVLLYAPGLSVAENWQLVMMASVPLRAPAGLLSDSSTAPLAPTSPTRADIAVPERASLSISKQIGTLLFLSVLQQSLESNLRVGISEIAKRVDMTYQGVLNRLTALELRLDGQDTLLRIRARITAERERLAPFRSWVHHAIWG